MAAADRRPGRRPPGDLDPGQLAGRLGTARDDGFVGRQAELRAVADAVSGVSATRVLFVHGPGGIGKTTLLEAMARQAGRSGHPTRYVDARDIECSPEAVGTLVRAADTEPGTLLLVDGYELLAPLDRWLRTELLPARPADAVTVLAGREAPSPEWWLDPGWRRLLEVLPLGRLDAGASRHLLTRPALAPRARS